MSDSKKSEGLIIDEPRLLGNSRRIFELVITMLGWYVWVILLIGPFLHLMNKYEDYRIEDFFSMKFINETLYLYQLSLTVFVIMLLMLFWNRFNIRKFRGKDRRKSSGFADSKLMGNYYNIPEEDINAIQKSRNINIDFLNNQKIVINDEVEGIYAPNNIDLHLKNITES